MSVQECAHLYPDGRHCRRIPKRGNQLCHGHLRPRRRLPGEQDAAFNQKMFAWADKLHDLPLEDVLNALARCLAVLHPILQRKASRRHRLAFTRATIALSVVIDELDAIAAQRAGHPTARPLLPQPLPPPVPQSVIDQLAAQLKALNALDPKDPAALVALDAWCEDFASTLPSDDKPHPLQPPMDTRHAAPPANASITKHCASPQTTVS